MEGHVSCIQSYIVEVDVKFMASGGEKIAIEGSTVHLASVFHLQLRRWNFWADAIQFNLIEFPWLLDTTRAINQVSPKSRVGGREEGGRGRVKGDNIC